MALPFALTWLLLLASAALAQDPSFVRLGDELLNARDPAVRRRAAEGLGRASTDLGVALLGRALPQERNREVRLAIVRGLRAIAFHREPGYRVAFDALGRAASDGTEPDELVRLRATEALWEAGEKDLLNPVPILEGQLADRSERLQLAAVSMLRKHGSPEAAEALGRAVLDAGLSETVRLAAADALGAVALSDPGEVGRQVAAANIGVTDHIGIPPVASPRALERRHQRQVAYLSALVRDPGSSEALVLQGVKSLGRVKDPSSLPVLRDLVQTHRSPAVRKQATRVLSHVLARQYE